ncbi:site-specific integrase [Paralimibaculum aggregatum]|uniref:Site-specific integrase n=1 Tax=Paralimibaculum aggregatum TaxID=3036245 RepID=A0ABQ6LHD5_9RHOB|nr:site-specific integrase [Limibaculum sp. NKW23]GMG82699.1 site-specific integrase [Limibaculum sp. NKW23]
MLINALSQMKAKHLPEGKHADGQGLWLVKRSKLSGKWILRLTIHGRRREMGLGPWPDVSIAEARGRAEDARRRVRGGDDPIEERAARRLRAKRLTVEEAIHGCFEARQAELKADGKAGRWLSPLAVHIIPAIGEVAIEDLDQHVIRKVLEPIWHEKPDTARKAMNRLNLTLKHAAALGLEVDMQATMKARALLGKQRHTVEHVPSIPYREAPAFYRMLSGKSFFSCHALRFLMLTVARTSEIRFALKDDLVDDVLVIPPERTKTGNEHRIPLSTEALDLIAQTRRLHDSDLLFPSPKGKPMSDATMARFMEREGYEARPHGFRSTFRTWVEECTDAPYEVKEACLGHIVDGAVVRAYQRSDRLERRRELMESWSSFLTGS